MVSHSFTNNAEFSDFQPTMRPFETPRERTYDLNDPKEGYTRHAPNNGFRHLPESKIRKPAIFGGTNNWSDYIVHFEMISELNYWSNETKSLELASSFTWYRTKCSERLTTRISLQLSAPGISPISKICTRKSNGDLQNATEKQDK